MSYKVKRLILCLLLDAVGMLSFVIPGIGEFSDIIWAPIAAKISYKMFGEKRGRFTATITFIEEILPIVDIIPSFTIFCILYDWIGVGDDNKQTKVSNYTKITHLIKKHSKTISSPAPLHSPHDAYVGTYQQVALVLLYS